MLSPKKTLIALIAINFITLLVVNINHSSVSLSTRITTTTDFSGPGLKFDNPTIAFYVLKQLDIFEAYELDVPPEQSQKIYTKPFLGLTAEDDYCEKHRAYFVNNPEIVFEEKNILTSSKTKAVFRTELIKQIGGTDSMPHIGASMPENLKKQLLYDMRPDLTMFFTAFPLYEARKIGKQFSCLSQTSNHIPGNEVLYRKDRVGTALIEYNKRYGSKPECFNYDKFFPKTWVLQDETQCRDFFNIFNSKEYEKMKEERGLVYMRKIGAFAHQGMGVFPVNATEEKYIKKLYKNGDLCGKIRENNLMQYAIYNPLLLNGRKFDFRIFMLIASTNPMMVYYRDGFLRVSLRDYNPKSEEIGSILTNIALSKPFFDLAKQNGTYNGFTEDDLMNQAFWPLPKLHKFLSDNGVVTDPEWLDNYLRPEFKRAMIHLMRMSQDQLISRSSLYEIYGLDFMLDSNLNLWFIEANAQPLLDGWSADTKKFFNDILIDSFEIVYGLLRSRMKRVVHFVNKIIREGEVSLIETEDVVQIENLAANKEEFHYITRNYFETEYEPSPSNQYHQIIDDNLTGKRRYMGLIDEECISL